MSSDREFLTALRNILESRFSEGELRAFSFDLKIPYDSLPGSDKPAKALELVDYARRRNKWEELIKKGKETRPDIDWPMLPQTTSPGINADQQDIQDILTIDRQIEAKRQLLKTLKERLTQADPSNKPAIKAKIQERKDEMRNLYDRLAVLLAKRLKNNSSRIYELINDKKYNKTTGIVNDLNSGIYTTLRRLHSTVNALIGEENTSSHWKKDNRDGKDNGDGNAIAWFIFGVIVAIFFTMGTSPSQGQNVLRPVQKYSFEREIPENLVITGIVAESKLGSIGFESKQSLELRLSLLPHTDESSQGVFDLTLPDVTRVEAISSAIFLPEDGTPQPIYVQFEAILGNDVQIYSNSTQIEPGFWVPIFWGTRSAYEDTTNIKILRLLMYCVDTPYNGLVYVDDVNIYDLVPEKPVNLMATPSPVRK